MIPLFLAEDEENYSSMVRQRVFWDLTNPFNCYNDLDRFRFSRSSISLITELIARGLNYTERSHTTPPYLQVCVL